MPEQSDSLMRIQLHILLHGPKHLECGWK